ncbi:hypothetical protein [Ekhidna sp.]|uniref:hypothetical protein n=1 Tax=Ekhidna sp. TaxID=2608089 RepID=UPI003299DD5B
MDNDQVLLETLAEDLESLKKKVKNLELQISKKEANTNHDGQIEKLVKLFNNLAARLKNLEDQKVISADANEPSQKLSFTRIKVNRKIAISYILIGAVIWYCVILVGRGIKYEEAYYKYQSMDLFGLEKQFVDYLYQVDKDSMMQLVDDSITHIDHRRNAQDQIEEYQKRINSLEEEFKLNSKND